MTGKRAEIVGAFVLFLLTSVLLGSAVSQAGDKGNEIRGTVTDGQKPLYGILVKAKAVGKNSATSVFTDERGEYIFPPLPAGSYTVSVGTEWKQKITLGNSSVKQDFTIELGPGLINQTSGTSWMNILPGPDEGRKVLFRNCSSCHSFLRPIENPRDSREEWLGLVQQMEAKPGNYRFSLTPETRGALADFLSEAVKPDIKDNPDLVIKAMVRPRGEAAKAVFTEWNLPYQLGEIIGVKVDSKGMYWFTTEKGDCLGRLNPDTGEFQTWPAPLPSGSRLHDLMFDQDGNIWTTAIDHRKVFRFDTTTLQFTGWDVPAEYGNQPHIGDLDADGNYWFTMFGGSGWVVKLDPHTGKFKGYPTKTPNPSAYGLVVDRKTGTVWFAELIGSRIAKIDPKTGELVEYPTLSPNAGSRRLRLDSKGQVWLTESFVDKVSKFDPITEKFTDYEVGSPGGFPYFINIDKFDNIWFNLSNSNELAKLDQKTGKITYILLPEKDSATRDPGFDYSDGRDALAYGTVARSAIGRVYLRP